MTQSEERGATHGVLVEYDYGTKGERRRKEFADAYKARRFFTAKDKAGKSPKVLAATLADHRLCVRWLTAAEVRCPWDSRPWQAQSHDGLGAACSAADSDSLANPKITSSHSYLLPISSLGLDADPPAVRLRR